MPYDPLKPKPWEIGVPLYVQDAEPCIGRVTLATSVGTYSPTVLLGAHVHGIPMQILPLHGYTVEHGDGPERVVVQRSDVIGALDAVVSALSAQKNEMASQERSRSGQRHITGVAEKHGTRYDRLPAWAKQEIVRLERDADEARAETERMKGHDDREVIAVRDRHDEATPVMWRYPDRERSYDAISFFYDDERFLEGIDVLHAGLRDGIEMVEIRAQHDLHVLPGGTNTIYVYSR